MVDASIGVCALLVYLWGIETSNALLHFLYNSFVISLPMRNWNSGAGEISASAYVISLPWGIETSNVPPFFLYNSSVISLPMRNWNCFLAWRQLNLFPVISLPWGIETSNSLPRPLCRPSLLVYLWGIETILHHQIPPFFYSVISLPMRNWNYHVCKSISKKLAVISLPMRNWNQK